MLANLRFCRCRRSPSKTAIAAFLDRETAKIDALVAEQRRLIELLKEKRQAVISHAVTKGLNPHAPMKPSGIEWLGDVPAHWDVDPLKRIARRHRERHTSSRTIVEYWDADAAFREYHVSGESFGRRTIVDHRASTMLNSSEASRTSLPAATSDLLDECNDRRCPQCRCTIRDAQITASWRSCDSATIDSSRVSCYCCLRAITDSDSSRRFDGLGASAI